MGRFFSALLICFACLANTCFSSTEGLKNMDNKHPVVTFTTNFGDFKAELYEDKAPETVANFLQYVKDGHFDRTIFHRVIDGFMIQGGGFTKDMQQKPTRAAIKNEADNGLKNTVGTLAMARTLDVNSATAQFFINVSDNGFLDFKSKNPSEYGYAVFGKVIEGMSTIEKIKNVKTGSKEGHRDVPVETVEILSATIDAAK